jgi:hypothetical protein
MDYLHNCVLENLVSYGFSGHITMISSSFLKMVGISSRKCVFFFCHSCSGEMLQIEFEERRMESSGEDSASAGSAG